MVFLRRLDPGSYAPRRGAPLPTLAPAADWPSREVQLDAARAFLPKPTARGAWLEAVAMRHAAGAFERHVEPLIAAHWPEILTPGQRHLHARLLALASHFYLVGLALGYFIAHPEALARLPEDEEAAAEALQGWLPAEMGMLQAAYLALADDAVDDWTAGLSGSALRAEVPGFLVGDDASPLAAVPAWQLLRAMVRRLTARIAMPLAHTPHVRGTVAILKEQLRAMDGVPDRERLFHRTIGLAGTAVSFGFCGFHTPEITDWGIGVGWMLQLLDDWIDVERDWQAGRVTGFTTHTWDRGDVERQLERLSAGLAAMIGEPEAHATVWSAYVATWRRYLTWA